MKTLTFKLRLLYPEGYTAYISHCVGKMHNSYIAISYPDADGYNMVYFTRGSREISEDDLDIFRVGCIFTVTFDEVTSGHQRVLGYMLEMGVMYEHGAECRHMKAVRARRAAEQKVCKRSNNGLRRLPGVRESREDSVLAHGYEFDDGRICVDLEKVRVLAGSDFDKYDFCGDVASDLAIIRQDTILYTCAKCSAFFTAHSKYRRHVCATSPVYVPVAAARCRGAKFWLSSMVRKRRGTVDPRVVAP